VGVAVGLLTGGSAGEARLSGEAATREAMGEGAEGEGVRWPDRRERPDGEAVEAARVAAEAPEGRASAESVEPPSRTGRAAKLRLVESLVRRVPLEVVDCREQGGPPPGDEQDPEVLAERGAA